MENKAEMLAAGREAILMIQEKLRDGQTIHVGTLVSAAARIAGTSLLRSFGLLANQKVEPGVILLSEEANREWPKLMSAVLATLKANGVEVDQAKLVFKPPEKHAPKQEILQMQVEFQDPYNRIMSQHGLDYRQGALAGALACAIAILESRKIVNPEITCGIAAMGFIEGSKTAPMPLAPETPAS